MLLSPNAPVFEPKVWMIPHRTTSPIYDNIVNLSIFDGNGPCLTVEPGSMHDILHGIQDQAIDEKFPPSAGEAAELEEAEMHVLVLAMLSMLEDREERTRSDFSHFIQKRWSTRRTEGLPINRKPRSSKGLIERVEHGHNPSPSLSSWDCRAVVEYYDLNEHKRNDRHRNRKDFRQGRGGHSRGGNWKRGLKGHQRPLHQPRKHN